MLFDWMSNTTHSYGVNNGRFLVSRSWYTQLSIDQIICIPTFMHPSTYAYST